MSWLQQKLSGLWQPSTDPAPAASASSVAQQKPSRSRGGNIPRPPIHPSNAAPAASASSAALVAPRGKQKLSKKSRKKKIWASSPQWCKDIATLQITRATPEMKRYT